MHIQLSNLRIQSVDEICRQENGNLKFWALIDILTTRNCTVSLIYKYICFYLCSVVYTKINTLFFTKFKVFHSFKTIGDISVYSYTAFSVGDEDSYLFDPHLLLQYFL
jgi:hypothetical protein